MPIAITDYKRARPIEVDLWGHLFEYVSLTKKTEATVTDALAQINKDFETEDLSKHATQVKAFAARMDVRLKPSAGGKKRASTLLKQKWTNDDLTMPQCDQFWEAVEEAVDSPGSSKVAIEDFAGAIVEIDLWGTAFEAIRVTATTEPEIDAQLEQISEEFKGKDLTAEIQVKVFAARFDARLRHVGESKAKPSELVWKKWNADEVEVPQLNQFWIAVLEELDRPS